MINGGFVLIALLVGVLVGLAAWLASGSRAREALGARIADLEGRARAAEGLAEEVRRQLDLKTRDAAGLQEALETERRARTEAQTRLEAEQRNLQEQRRLLEDAEQRLQDTFKALSSDALRSNNESFLDLARQKLDAIVSETTGDIDKRQQAIDTLIKPLTEALRRYEEQIQTMEQARRTAYGSLQEQLRALGETQQLLQRETGNLVTALRSPQVRGRWGEITLRRVVELSGMSRHCDFEEQVTVDTEEGRLRPDMRVRLPVGRTIVVDAKVSLDGYLDAISAETDEQRGAAMARHAQQIRGHMQRLASKQYWDQFPEAPEFVVMFIPGESFFSAAVDIDRSLIEDAMARKVALATPTTLIALLRAVAYGWRQEQIAQNARQISDLGKQLHDRLKTLAEHINGIGQSLGKAVVAYNKAVASVETRILPAARRFRDMGATGGEEIPPLEGIDEVPRPLSLPGLLEDASPVEEAHVEREE